MKKTFLAAAVVASVWPRQYPFFAWAPDPTRRRGSACGPSGPRARRPWGAAGAWADRWAAVLREVMRDLTDAQREQVKAIHERHAERNAAADRARARRA